MKGSTSVIEALRKAREAAPDDSGLALHLAALLVEAEGHDEALGLYQAVMAADPTHLAALEGALRCAEPLGRTGLAEGYRRLLQALGGPSTPAAGDAAPSRGPVKLRVVGGRDAGEGHDDSETPELTLADVGGMEAVKQRLQRAFLGPLRNPTLMSAYGKGVGGGLLLYGPPGCGKTFIARALAGELGARFFNVGLSDVLDMYLGESERRLHELFETARRKAPAVLFFDELDAIGQKRSHLRASGMRSVVNQLLAEMDSIGSHNTNLFIVGATNHPWDVDAALKRPGRFDRLVAVFPPDTPARRAILELHLRGKPTEGLDLERLAARCQEFSGADLKHLVDTAVEYVMEASLASGRVHPIGQADLERAQAELRPSARSWFETARNYVLFANEGGSYDDLVEYMRKERL